MNIFGVDIKNLLNLEIKQNDRNNDKYSMLAYEIKSFYCFPEKIQYVAKEGDYKTKELKYFLDRLKENSEKFSELKKIIIYQIEIKNIGNEIISASDFFENSKLRVNSYGLYLGFIDTRLTPQYINANINKWEDNEYFISFDCIKPNDSIYLSFVSDKERLPIDVLGETKTFKFPIPLSYFSQKNQSNIKILIFKLVTVIIILGCLMLSLYVLEHPNLMLQIRLIDGVENNAK